MQLAANQATTMDLNEFAYMPPMWRFVKSGFKVEALRTNTLLMKDDWAQLDTRVVEVSGTILNGVSDLEAFGLTVPTGGLGTMISQYHQASAMRAATITMDPRVDAERDRRTFPLVSVPVPIVMCPFELNIRELAAARQHGHALDTTHIDDAIRSVSEGIESLLFSGSSLVVQGQTIYGYTNHPNRNTATGADWGTATNIYINVLDALATITGDGYTGPNFRLYLHPDQFLQTLQVSANTAVPIRNLIESLPGFGPGSVKMAGSLTAGQGVMVNMTSNVVDMAIGQTTTVVEWQEHGGMQSEFVVMACITPRVKATADGKSGICHISSI